MREVVPWLGEWRGGFLRSNVEGCEFVNFYTIREDAIACPSLFLRLGLCRRKVMMHERGMSRPGGW